MGQYLLKFGKKRNWDDLGLAWLPRGAIQADPATDLRISSGKLSVWWIEEDRSNIDLVILALASSRQHLEKIEFGLFEDTIPGQIGIKVAEEVGVSPVPSVNHYHRNFIEMTTDQLTTLVNSIFFNISKSRKLKPEITKLLTSEWGNKIDVGNVKPDLRSEIENEIQLPG